MSTISTNAIQSVGTTLQLGTQNNTKAQVDSSGNFSSVIPGGTTLLPEFKCRAWVNWQGSGTSGIQTIRGSGNVSSVVRNSAGNYTISFATAMPDALYNYATGGGSNSLPMKNNQTTASITITTTNASSGANNDATFNDISIFR